MLKKISSTLLVLSLAFSWAGSSPVDAAVTKRISWKWSDGVAAGSRNFASGKYKSGDDYPLLVITIKPRSIPRIVSISWLNGNSVWREMNRAQSVDGVVTIRPDLDCYDYWFPCGGTQEYRIEIEPSGDQPKYKPVSFTITYSSSRSSSSGSSSGGSSSGSSSSGSGGVSAAYFIGWNLEEVQDYLGYDPRTSDCSGWGRSVWWSSNWWVIGAYGGTLIVSKSRSGCS